MTIDDNLIDGKLQYDIKREAANIPALSSGKIDIYIYINILQVKKYYHMIKEEE